MSTSWGKTRICKEDTISMCALQVCDGYFLLRVCRSTGVLPVTKSTIEGGKASESTSSYKLIGISTSSGVKI